MNGTTSLPHCAQGGRAAGCRHRPAVAVPIDRAREARLDSDIDLLAAFDDAQALSLLDVIGIENRLADLLGRPVDLIEEGTLRRARQTVSREVVRAF